MRDASPASARTPATPGATLSRDRRATTHKARLFLALALPALALVAASCGNGPSASAQASSLVSQGVRAEATGHSQRALHYFHSAAAVDRSDAVPFYEIGVLYQRSLHDSARAATAYKRALSLDPTYRSAMFDLAIVDTPTAPQDALNLYNELLLRNPNDADVNFNLGLLLIVLKQPVPGHAALKRAVTLNPALARRLPAGITP